MRTLADRLGKTAHVSVLRHKIRRLYSEYPSPTATCLEHWLIDVANHRDARIVQRPGPPSRFRPPDARVFSNTELVVALCQLQCLDQPQILRLAAQLISRGAFEPSELKRLAEMERTVPILAELSRLALRVEPGNPRWCAVASMFGAAAPLREPLIHWSRLAQAIPKDGRVNATAWKLVT